VIKSITLVPSASPGMSLEAFREYYETRHAPSPCRSSRALARYQRKTI
jgi:hypothetical protein